MFDFQPPRCQVKRLILIEAQASLLALSIIFSMRKFFGIELSLFLAWLLFALSPSLQAAMLALQSLMLHYKNHDKI